MFTDYVLNGEGHGEVGESLSRVRFDPTLRRTWTGRDGRNYVTVNSGRLNADGTPVFENRLAVDMIGNGVPIEIANAMTLRKDEWIHFDKAILKAARQRLRAWADLAAASSYGGFDGMSKTILEHETQSDDGEAIVDMDGLSEGRSDTSLSQLEGTPLPITHSNFFFSSRKLAESRNSGTPLDVTRAEQSGRRVAEEIEKTLIGEATGITYGKNRTTLYGTSAGKVWGYTNFPDRITKTDVTTPDGTNGATTVDDVLAMIALAADANHFGPFMLYHSTDWDQYMDDDYRANDSRTLRGRLRDIDAIQDVRRLDYLDDTHTLLLIQMTSNVVRAIMGMDFTTLRWESKGGMQVNFKVMAIQVPQIRSDYNGNTGIVHGTTS